MLLTVDIGNTNISVGGFRGEELRFHFQLKSDIDRTSDEYLALLLALFGHNLSAQETIQTSIMSSVVPPLTGRFAELLRNHFHVEPLIVGPGVKTGISVATTDPNAVGADRVVNAVAAKAFYGTPAFVVDFSTATSIDYVNREGAYAGGIIMPGLGVSLDALVKRTSQLPRIDLVWPERVIGRNTKEAMQSGAVIGYLSMVEGTLMRASEEVGGVDCVVLTGDLSDMFVAHSSVTAMHDPFLTLKGLAVIARLNGL